jgi:predicted Holliday junction resolvase-like endonuclease
MEIILAGLLVSLAGCVILVLLVMLASARRHADTADERALQKVDDAVARAHEQLRKAEQRIRADAIKKSTAVVKGKVAEQLVPFQADFGFNPRDARFLGSPVDLIVFEGLTEGDVTRVVFIEVKSGKYTRLSRREKQVQLAIENDEVYYEVLHVGGN